MPSAFLRGAKPLVLAALLALPAVGLARAGDLPGTDGDLLIHGNYCGPGSRAGRAPVDALDTACMHHDACSPPVGTGLPSCACNARLAREAEAVANSPADIPDEERTAAGFVAVGARVLACR